MYKWKNNIVFTLILNYLINLNPHNLCNFNFFYFTLFFTFVMIITFTERKKEEAIHNTVITNYYDKILLFLIITLKVLSVSEVTLSSMLDD